MTAERLDRFMARANAVYYASHDPFADFTTSPEISQAFGEILGLWAAVAWQSLGRPDPVLLVEAGPGRGTLMADALRAARAAMPAFALAARVHFIEASVRLRAAQAVRVPEAAWHDGLETVPDAPMILLANEFLDALPIRQFVRRGDGWAERHVAGGSWVECPAGDAAPAGREAAEGEVVEVNEAARAFVSAVAGRLTRAAGAALLVDYGPAQSGVGQSGVGQSGVGRSGVGRSGAGATLQAIAGGRMASPLSLPGSADLTAHVDFADLAGCARAAGAEVQGPVTQGAFLTALGLAQRTERLARGRGMEQAAALREAAVRLADPGAMGGLFKVMAVVSPGCAWLPGVAATLG